MNKSIDSSLAAGPLAGFVVVLDGGTHAFLGLPSPENGGGVYLSPVYHLEGQLQASGDPRDPEQRINISRPIRVTPVLGFVSLRGLTVSARAPQFPVSMLSAPELRKLIVAYEICERILRVVRADDAGITTSVARPGVQ